MRVLAVEAAHAGELAVEAHRVPGVGAPGYDLGMITGLHAIVFSPEAEKVRAFFSDTLGLSSVDAGGGWLIFAMPPAELAVHPAGEGRHELYLMCDDIDATVAELREKGAGFSEGIVERPWGRSTTLELPGGGQLPLYEPSHPSPLAS